MAGWRLPVLGRSYCVLCPVCSNTVSFTCQDTNTYGVKCYVCQTHINLQNPSVPLLPEDTGHPLEHDFSGDGGRGARYSVEVEESDGSSAGTQVAMLMDEVIKEQERIVRNGPSTDAREVLSARRMQAMSDKMWFLHPLVYGVEYLFFGNKPVTRVGNVRLFRRRLPLVGSFYVPVVKTSTSYAVPLSLLIVFSSMLLYVVNAVNEPHLWSYVKCFFALAASTCTAMLAAVYSDPGYVRPAVLSARGAVTGSVSEQGGEQHSEKCASIWEVVNGERVERRWCNICAIHRPLRATHCYLCGMCVDEQDHHCAVIGVCVGRRNIGMFLLFVLLSVIAASTMGVTAMTVLRYCSRVDSQDEGNPATAGNGMGCKALTPLHYVLTVLIIICVIIFCLVTTFLLFSVLTGVVTAQTTRERLKGIHSGEHNPFNKGVLRNTWSFITRGKPPSIIDDELVATCLTRGNTKEGFVL